MKNQTQHHKDFLLQLVPVTGSQLLHQAKLCAHLQSLYHQYPHLAYHKTSNKSPWTLFEQVTSVPDCISTAILDPCLVYKTQLLLEVLQYLLLYTCSFYSKTLYTQ